MHSYTVVSVCPRGVATYLIICVFRLGGLGEGGPGGFRAGPRG